MITQCKHLLVVLLDPGREVVQPLSCSLAVCSWQYLQHCSNVTLRAMMFVPGNLLRAILLSVPRPDEHKLWTHTL